MSYQLIFAPRALEDIRRIKKSGNKPVIKKLQMILQELMEHPTIGIGTPELLRNRENTYSRRLNLKDRIVYSVHEDIVCVNILQTLGHYNDK
ncbi:MAG: type II toxin-antitoxin system YoeB family toxin [Bacteroidia bacterium]|nr:type II toxin-antitoxin system YoeB family toxin [Bacteroidia bacterium]